MPRRRRVEGTAICSTCFSSVEKPKVAALNKVDRLEKEKLLPLIERYGRAGFADVVPISALTGDNVERLETVLLSHLPEGEPLYDADYLTDQPERFFVAELVREQVLQHTHAELPFSSAVIIDRFEEPDEKGLLRLYCTILVERESQKPIVIGRGGEMIKTIGSGGSPRARALFRRSCVSRSPREGPRRLARGRTHARHAGTAAGEAATTLTPAG